MAAAIERVLVLLLSIGIFPSLMALSVPYSESFSGLARWTGPLNPGKLLLPVLLLWLFAVGKPWRAFPWIRYLGIAWAIGTLSTLIAASRCGFPPLFLREWTNISVGLLAGVFFASLTEERRREVVLPWFGVVTISVVLGLFFPAIVDWFYAHVFGPETRAGDLAEVGPNVLSGFFGRQSLAKLMAWVPWLVLPFVFSRIKNAIFPFAILGLFFGLILATSQRGPTLAAFAGLGAFGIHQHLYSRSIRAIVPSAVAVIVGLISIFVFVPRDIVTARVASAIVDPASNVSMPEKERATAARDNAAVRGTMAKASFEMIANSPLGNACIPESFFAERGFFASHSHSLFLEQLRSRGWIWGFLHLALWLVAGVGFWRRPDATGAAYFGGWTTIMISGLFDHPWFVLNHALVLGVFLVAGLAAYFPKRVTE